MKIFIKVGAYVYLMESLELKMVTNSKITQSKRLEMIIYIILNFGEGVNMNIQALIDKLQTIRNKHKQIWVDEGVLIISGDGDSPINLNEDSEIE